MPSRLAAARPPIAIDGKYATDAIVYLRCAAFVEPVRRVTPSAPRVRAIAVAAVVFRIIRPRSVSQPPATAYPPKRRNPCQLQVVSPKVTKTLPFGSEMPQGIAL